MVEFFQCATVVMYLLMLVLAVFGGSFIIYTAVRDDFRREKERKQKKNTYITD